MRSVGYASRLLEFEKGKAAIIVGDNENLVAVLMLLLPLLAVANLMPY